jgi:hypothetical protein
MGFLNGSLACTRFNVVSLPDSVQFEKAAFQMIQPGSNLVETAGFIPFELDEPECFGKHRYAFRVRMDKVTPDSTLVNERLRQLVKTEIDRGERVTPKKRKKLKELAEDQIRSKTLPRSKIVEGVIDHDILYVASTSKTHLGTVLALLQKVGVEVEYKTPWLDAALEEPEESDLIDLKEPGQSIYGSRFLKKLLEDGEIICEPEKGSVKLATRTHAKASLTGEVLGDLDHYLEEGAELISAKMIFGETPFTLDGLAYRITGLKLPKVREDHWTQTLEGRLELLESVWETLDAKFAVLMNVKLPERERPEINREQLEEEPKDHECGGVFLAVQHRYTEEDGKVSGDVDVDYFHSSSTDDADIQARLVGFCDQFGWHLERWQKISPGALQENPSYRI